MVSDKIIADYWRAAAEVNQISERGAGAARFRIAGQPKAAVPTWPLFEQDLFRAQRVHWLDAGGSSGWDEAGQRCCGPQH